MFYDTAFFDLDGTLTDSVPGIVNSVKYALEKGGYPPLTQAQLRSCVGPPLREQFMKLLNVDEAESTRLLGLYREYFSVRGIYEPGCELFRKRMECAIMLKVAEEM